MTINSNTNASTSTDEPQPTDPLTAGSATDTLPAGPVANPRRTRLHLAAGRSALPAAAKPADS